MRRLTAAPRIAWQARVEEAGFTFHTDAAAPYWNESAVYELTSQDIERLETSSNALHLLCLETVAQIIRRNWFGRLRIPPKVVPWIIESWDRQSPSIYGRFDLAYDGNTEPKLLEYNADTATALLEAATIQRDWLGDVLPGRAQFNRIYESLVEAWGRVGGNSPIYFTAIDAPEDRATVEVLRTAAACAGRETEFVDIRKIAWHSGLRRLIDPNGTPIEVLFKLYPWEWLLDEPFAEFAIQSRNLLDWIEPPWKMLLSNKAILPILWELYPGHPNLLPAYFYGPGTLQEFVRKPFHSREGASVTLVTRTGIHQTPGEYGDRVFVYQQRGPMPNLAGNYPVFGVWVVNGVASGLGIRESSSPITDLSGRFVPHVVLLD